jgi:7-keto-8-aminopelargonate synthetase-like enzyme
VPLQQVERTSVVVQGRKLVYFAGCDYFRLSSHPAILTALRDGLERYGLNVAASRKTTGNHVLYEQLESAVADFFGADVATLFSNGYMANLGVAQALAGDFSCALLDEKSHSSLAEAARFLDCPVHTFSHRDPVAALRVLKRVKPLKRGGRVLLLTDGLFSHSGEVAPLPEYLRVLPSGGMLLVDDAHGAGILGRHGRGTLEQVGVPRRRIIQTVTLSKAFGAYGGAVLGDRALRRRVLQRSRLFAGNTPLPLPLASAALASVNMLRRDPRPRRRLLVNANYVKAALREAGLRVTDGPAPIIPIHRAPGRFTERLQSRLRSAGIHPPYINYLGGPQDGYFRFVISSEHTTEQLDSLVRVLTTG